MDKKKKRIGVFVSKENIEDGMIGNACCCPIALAIADKYKVKPSKIYVSPETLVIGRKGHYYFKLSDEGINFLKRYDAGLSVDPITVHADLVKFYAK